MPISRRRDRALLANAPYARVTLPAAYQRTVVQFHRKDAPGKAEWPSWTPTAEIKRRLGNIPDFVEGDPHNPMGARALYLYQADKDTLFRIHGTNQPENIGRAVSSGCIRMTNEDVIDLYNRVKMGAIVVVLAPKQIDSPAPTRNVASLRLVSAPARGDGGAPR